MTDTPASQQREVSISVPRSVAADLLTDREWVVTEHGRWIDPETHAAYWELDEALTIALCRDARTADAE